MPAMASADGIPHDRSIAMRSTTSPGGGATVATRLADRSFDTARRSPRDGTKTASGPALRHWRSATTHSNATSWTGARPVTASHTADQLTRRTTRENHHSATSVRPIRRAPTSSARRRVDRSDRSARDGGSAAVRPAMAGQPQSPPRAPGSPALVREAPQLEEREAEILEAVEDAVQVRCVDDVAVHDRAQRADLDGRLVKLREGRAGDLGDLLGQDELVAHAAPFAGRTGCRRLLIRSCRSGCVVASPRAGDLDLPAT